MFAYMFALNNEVTGGGGDPNVNPYVNFFKNKHNFFWQEAKSKKIEQSLELKVT